MWQKYIWDFFEHSVSKIDEFGCKAFGGSIDKQSKDDTIIEGLLLLEFGKATLCSLAIALLLVIDSGFYEKVFDFKFLEIGAIGVTANANGLCNRISVLVVGSAVVNKITAVSAPDLCHHA